MRDHEGEFRITIQRKAMVNQLWIPHEIKPLWGIHRLHLDSAFQHQFELGCSDGMKVNAMTYHFWPQIRLIVSIQTHFPQNHKARFRSGQPWQGGLAAVSHHTFSQAKIAPVRNCYLSAGLYSQMHHVIWSLGCQYSSQQPFPWENIHLSCWITQ